MNLQFRVCHLCLVIRWAMFRIIHPSTFYLLQCALCCLSLMSPCSFISHFLIFFTSSCLSIALDPINLLPFHLVPPLIHFLNTSRIRNYIHLFFLDSLFKIFRWRPQHFCTVCSPRPHHHWGHAGQQRHRPSSEHVPGALPVPTAGQLPGGCVGGAFGACGRCFHLQHPAGSGRSARNDLKCQLLCHVARRSFLPVGGPGGAAVPKQAEADVTDPDGG